jgi:hypothetical protein
MVAVARLRCSCRNCNRCVFVNVFDTEYVIDMGQSNVSLYFSPCIIHPVITFEYSVFLCARSILTNELRQCYGMCFSFVCIPVCDVVFFHAWLLQ